MMNENSVKNTVFFILTVRSSTLSKGGMLQITSPPCFIKFQQNF